MHSPYRHDANHREYSESLIIISANTGTYFYDTSPSAFQAVLFFLFEFLLLHILTNTPITLHLLSFPSTHHLFVLPPPLSPIPLIYHPNPRQLNSNQLHLTQLTVTVMAPPLGVNLRALEIKFLITWSILNLSTYTQSSLLSGLFGVYVRTCAEAEKRIHQNQN